MTYGCFWESRDCTAYDTLLAGATPMAQCSSLHVLRIRRIYWSLSGTDGGCSGTCGRSAARVHVLRLGGYSDLCWVQLESAVWRSGVVLFGAIFARAISTALCANKWCVQGATCQHACGEYVQSRCVRCRQRTIRCAHNMSGAGVCTGGSALSGVCEICPELVCAVEAAHYQVCAQYAPHVSMTLAASIYPREGRVSTQWWPEGGPLLHAVVYYCDADWLSAIGQRCRRITGTQGRSLHNVMAWTRGRDAKHPHGEYLFTDWSYLFSRNWTSNDNRGFHYVVVQFWCDSLMRFAIKSRTPEIKDILKCWLWFLIEYLILFSIV